MSATHTPEGLREAVARIIEPSAWRGLDALTDGLLNGTACDTISLGRAVRDGVTDAASLKAWWLAPHDLDTYFEKDCRRSLAKAETILAALPPNSREPEGAGVIDWRALAIAQGEVIRQATAALSAPSPAEPAKGSGELIAELRADKIARRYHGEDTIEFKVPATGLERRAADMIEALSRRTGSEVPQGWRLVPVEPTPEMLAASGGEPNLHNTSWHVARDIYRAMLAAAPPPEGRG